MNTVNLTKIWLFFALFLLPGCTTIITSGNKITTSSLAAFKPQQTTPADVVKALGRPDSITENNLDKTTTFTYQRVSDKTVVFIPLIRKAVAGQVLAVAFKNNLYLGYVLTDLSQGIFFTSAPAKEDQSASNIKVTDEFKNPQRVEIEGCDYARAAMEPYISRDGKYLFFNNNNDPPEKTDLFYAERIDDTHFKFMGEVKGVNQPPPSIDGAANMSNNGNFYFTSSVDYAKTYSTIFVGHFEKGKVTDVHIVGGDFNRKKAGWVMMDVEISADDNTLYFSDAFFAKGIVPTTSRLGIAYKNEKNEFNVPKNAEEILKSTRSNDLEYAPAISNDGLELFFTRLASKSATTTILRVKRKTLTEPFGEAEMIGAISGFVEGPTLTNDGKKLYYKTTEGSSYAIYLVSR